MAVVITEQARVSWETFQQMAPEVISALRAIGKTAREAGLEKEMLELIKLRASQLNGCAFCLQFHLNDARRMNISAARLDLLSSWRDAGIYSPREMAALAWTERVTLLSQAHIDDAAFAEVSAHFSEREIAFLTVAIGQINFWNRIAAPLRFVPPIPDSAA